jgi:CBS domain containing-hemolysin-like protein
LEPPQLFELLLTLLSSAALFILASYEATFSVLSRSNLERMKETGTPRALLMWQIYEPRHRLHLMARLGQGFCAAALALALFFLLRAYVDARYATLGVTAAVSLCVLFATATARRVRFEDEDENWYVPRAALLFVPLYVLLFPFTALAERVTNGDYSDEEFKAEKEEELRSLVESEGETGVLEEGERDMIEGVFGFHDRVVREVMVPRVDVTAVEQSGTLNDLLTTIRDTGHSRVPIYQESLDSIRGIVFAKDLLQLIEIRADLNDDSPLSLLVDGIPAADGETLHLLHEPYYVPETKKIDQLLRDLSVARTRLAVAVDEYGGTAGLVTTEDLVEEIVGDLQDEFDAEEALYNWQTPDEILIVNPRISIAELNDLLGSDLPSDGFDTLGGFIYNHVGHVPEGGQTITVPNFEIIILAVDGQRIQQVQMKRIAAEDNGNGEPDETSDSES